METFTRSIMLQVGRMVDAKIAGLADRLLPEQRMRPPLAVDTTPSVVVGATKKPQKKGAASSLPKSETGKSAGAATTVAPPAAPVEKSTEAWSTVVKSKGRLVAVAEGETLRKTATQLVAKQVPVAKQKPKGPQPNKLRPPNSTAVLLSLQTKGEKVVSYASVLLEAKINYPKGVGYWAHVTQNTCYRGPTTGNSWCGKRREG